MISSATSDGGAEGEHGVATVVALGRPQRPLGEHAQADERDQDDVGGHLGDDDAARGATTRRRRAPRCACSSQTASMPPMSMTIATVANAMPTSVWRRGASVGPGGRAYIRCCSRRCGAGGGGVAGGLEVEHRLGRVHDRDVDEVVAGRRRRGGPLERLAVPRVVADRRRARRRVSGWRTATSPMKASTVRPIRPWPTSDEDVPDDEVVVVVERPGGLVEEAGDVVRERRPARWRARRAARAGRPWPPTGRCPTASAPSRRRRPSRRARRRTRCRSGWLLRTPCPAGPRSSTA